MPRQRALLGAAIIPFLMLAMVSLPNATFAETSGSLIEDQAQAQAFDVDGYLPDDEDLLASTATSDTYDAGNGIRVTEISYENMNVESEDGEWIDVSTTVTKAADGTLEVPDNPLEPKFAKSATAAELMTVTNGEHELAVTFLDAKAGKPAAITTPAEGDSKSEVTYENATKNGDTLRYEVHSSSVKETLELKSAPVKGESEWDWRVSGVGLTLSKNGLGDLRFLDSNRDVKFVIPAPVMWDSSGLSGVREPAEHPVETTIRKDTDGSWIVTLKGDHNWLNSPERVYPVFVDPTTSIGDTTVTAYKSDGATRTDAVHIGNSRDSNTDKYWRSRVSFNYSGIYGKQVVDASLSAAYLAGTNIARNATVNNVSGSGYNGLGARLATLSIGTSGVTPASNVDLPDRISDLVNARSAQPLMIRGTEIPGDYTYKKLNTTLKVAWRVFPSVTGPVDPAPQSGDTSSVAPALAVDIANVGTNPQTRFMVFAGASTSSSPVITTQWSANEPYFIGRNVLTPNTLYSWVAEVRDSQNLLYGTNAVRRSAIYTFTTDDDPAGQTTNVTAEPKFLDTSGTPVTTTRPLIGSLISGYSLLPWKFEAEVWTSTSNGTLVGACQVEEVQPDSFDSCLPDAVLSESTTYAMRTRASSDHQVGVWSDWATFVTGSPGTTPPPVTDSSDLPTDPVVEGTLLDLSGNPAPQGTIVTLNVVPSNEQIEAADLGEVFLTPSVASATVGTQGSYALTMDPDQDFSQFVSDDGEYVNVTIDATYSGSTASYSGTVHLQPDTETATGEYPDAFFSNDALAEDQNSSDDSFVVRPTIVGSALPSGLLENIGEQYTAFGEPADEELAPLTPADWPSAQAPAEISAGMVSPIVTAPVGSSGSTPFAAAKLAAQSELCATQVVKRWKAPTIVGSAWKKANSAKIGFSYTSDASTEVGVGVSASGKFGSFKAGGTSKTGSSGSVSWTTSTSLGNYGFTTNGNYAKIKTFCYAGGQKYTVKATDISGGRLWTYPGNTPTATFCDPYAPDEGDVVSMTSKTGTVSGGADVSSIIGMDLSTKTDFTKSSRMTVSDFTKTVQICGSKGGFLSKNAGFVVVKN